MHHVPDIRDLSLQTYTAVSKYYKFSWGTKLAAVAGCEASHDLVPNLPHPHTRFDTVRRNKQRHNVVSANWNMAIQTLCVNMTQATVR